MSRESDRNELGGRASNHLKTQNGPNGGRFLRDMAKFAQGNGKTGAKPRGHLKSDARRDGGTHKR
jgi:hypothetical protein